MRGVLISKVIIRGVPPSTLSYKVDCYKYADIYLGDVDFLPVSREILLEPDQLRLCLSIPIVNDSLVEKTEDFLVVIENTPVNDLIIEGISIAPTITYICIIDDDSESSHT